jgi:hypothetical protein
MPVTKSATAPGGRLASYVDRSSGARNLPTHQCRLPRSSLAAIAHSRFWHDSDFPARPLSCRLWAQRTSVSECVNHDRSFRVIGNYARRMRLPQRVPLRELQALAPSKSGPFPARPFAGQR